MTKYLEPEVIDPRELEAGDQVGCSDAGTRLSLIVGGGGDTEPIWMTLANAPGGTTEVPEYGWMRPLPHGNVALDLADHGWIWGVYPRVWARKEIR